MPRVFKSRVMSVRSKDPACFCMSKQWQHQRLVGCWCRWAGSGTPERLTPQQGRSRLWGRWESEEVVLETVEGVKVRKRSIGFTPASATGRALRRRPAPAGQRRARAAEARRSHGP